MRAIRRSKKHEDLVRLLTEKNHPEAGRPIFPTMRELLCFAAVLGFEIERKRELQSETLEIDGRTFDNHEQSRDLIYLIALADMKDAEVLRDENDDQRVGIFEQYAEAGLTELQCWLGERPEDPNGDLAILAAMQKRGYLRTARSVDDAIHDVTF